MYGLSSTRSATDTYRSPAASRSLRAAALLCTLLARAALADSTACAAADTSLNCRLQAVLHWLEGAALILGILLVVVVAAAIHVMRKNRLSRKGPQ